MPAKYVGVFVSEVPGTCLQPTQKYKYRIVKKMHVYEGLCSILDVLSHGGAMKQVVYLTSDSLPKSPPPPHPPPPYPQPNTNLIIYSIYSRYIFLYISATDRYLLLHM
jgi:hypothetical protein